MTDNDRPTGAAIIEEIDRLKRELDELRPLPSDVVDRVGQKLRIDSNYHSNALEGNSLTLGETRSLILHGLTARGKPMRDHLDIEGHNEAVKAVEEAVKADEALSEVFIRNLHRVLLKEPYEIDAVTPDGQPAKRWVATGDYKAQPNNVLTSTGEIYHYTPPEQVKPAMSDLLDWYRTREKEGEHPIVLAATFHYRFVRIHPFDDGNGRMARLLMNMILIRHGYTVAIVPRGERSRYIEMLEQADRSEDLGEFIAFLAGCCRYALNLHLKAARGESIEDVEDIDKEIALFLQKVMSGTIDARAYWEQVLNPFYLFCEEKIKLFTRAFERMSFGGSSTVSDPDSKNHRFSLEKQDETWPDKALAISTQVIFELNNYQGKFGEKVFLRIENKTDSDGNVWDFSAETMTSGETYLTSIFKRKSMGGDLQSLKGIFNEMIRVMMVKLSEI